MHQSQEQDPLHGISLQKILEYLEAKLGWEKMGQQVKIKCFTHDPSIKSSLKFLRKTPWAREKVEQLYIRQVQRNSKQAARSGDFVWPDISAD